MSDLAPHEDPDPLPNLIQIDALLRFLPVFGTPTDEHAQWHSGHGTFPSISLSEDADGLFMALYDECFVYSFDWISWQ